MFSGSTVVSLKTITESQSSLLFVSLCDADTSFPLGILAVGWISTVAPPPADIKARAATPASLPLGQRPLIRGGVKTLNLCLFTVIKLSGAVIYDVLSKRSVIM